MTVEEVGPLVRKVLAPNPGLMTGPGTNTYLVGVDEIVVVDPGPDVASHVDAIVGCGGDRIRWIALTHSHDDHAGGAASLAAATGAQVLAYGDIDEGFEVEATEFRLEALHTPGHSPDHLCYLLEEERLLFSGDHIMQGSTVVISPPDGDMAQYLESLRRLLDMRFKAIAPGHGDLIDDPAAKIKEYLTHRQAREDAIVAAMTGVDETTIDEIVAKVYVDVAEHLHPIARHSVHAHLLKLASEGRATGADGAWHPRAA